MSRFAWIIFVHLSHVSGMRHRGWSAAHVRYTTRGSACSHWESNVGTVRRDVVQKFSEIELFDLRQRQDARFQSRVKITLPNGMSDALIVRMMRRVIPAIGLDRVAHIWALHPARLCRSKRPENCHVHVCFNARELRVRKKIRTYNSKEWLAQVKEFVAAHIVGAIKQDPAIGYQVVERKGAYGPRPRLGAYTMNKLARGIVDEVMLRCDGQSLLELRSRNHPLWQKYGRIIEGSGLLMEDRQAYMRKISERIETLAKQAREVDEEIGRMATEHLIAQGCRLIGHIRNFDSRFRGFAPDGAGLAAGVTELREWQVGHLFAGPIIHQLDAADLHGLLA